MKTPLFIKLAGISIICFILALVCYHFSGNAFEYDTEKLTEMLITKTSYKTSNEAISWKGIDSVIVKVETANVYIKSTNQDEGAIVVTTGGDQNTAFHIQKLKQDVMITQGDLKRYPDSSITIKIPASVSRVLIQSVKGDVRLQKLELQKAEVSTVHGDISFENNNISEGIIESAAGDVYCDSFVNNLTIKTVTGDIVLVARVEAPQYKINSVNGDIDIKTTDEVNATLDTQSVTGSVQNTHYHLKAPGPNQKQGEIVVKSINGDINVH